MEGIERMLDYQAEEGRSGGNWDRFREDVIAGGRHDG